MHFAQEAIHRTHPKLNTSEVKLPTYRLETYNNKQHNNVNNAHEHNTSTNTTQRKHNSILPGGGTTGNPITQRGNTPDVEAQKETQWHNVSSRMEMDVGNS